MPDLNQQSVKEMHKAKERQEDDTSQCQSGWDMRDWKIQYYNVTSYNDMVMSYGRCQ